MGKTLTLIKLANKIIRIHDVDSIKNLKFSKNDDQVRVKEI